MLLAEPEKYRSATNAIKRYQIYAFRGLKKISGRKYYPMNQSQMASVIIVF